MSDEFSLREQLYKYHKIDFEKFCSIPTSTYERWVHSGCIRLNTKLKTSASISKSCQLSVTTFFDILSTPFDGCVTKDKLKENYDKCKPSQDFYDNSAGIDKIHCRLLHKSMRNMLTVPFPNEYVQQFNINMMLPNHTEYYQGRWRRVLFLFMKVRLNVKIISTQAAFDEYKAGQNFNKLTIQHPVLLACDLNDVTHKLDWVQDYKGILQGPALTWLMVFPNSHFYYVNSKFGWDFLPLPYDWLGFDMENQCITKILLY